MEIKKLAEGSFIQAEETLPERQNIQPQTLGLSDVADSIEKFSGHSNLFEALVAQPQAPSQAQEIGQRLDELGQQKTAIKAQIVSLEQRIRSLEESQVQSPNQETLEAIQNAMQELKSLQAELAKVDIQIKDLLNQLEQLQEKEDAVTDSIRSAKEPAQGIIENVEKAADFLTDVRSTLEDLD